MTPNEHHTSKPASPTNRRSQNDLPRVALFVLAAMVVSVLIAMAAGSGQTRKRPQNVAALSTSTTQASVVLTPTPQATFTPTTVWTPTSSPEATPVPADTPTPQPTPYTGPNEVSMTYDPSSCHPSGVSPYPYLDIQNISQTIPMTWKLTLSDPSFSLWKTPPNPLQPGISGFFALVGPMTVSGPITVTFVANIGSWSGQVQPCAG